jgi:hypothetical protein
MRVFNTGTTTKHTNLTLKTWPKHLSSCLPLLAFVQSNQTFVDQKLISATALGVVKLESMSAITSVNTLAVTFNKTASQFTKLQFLPNLRMGPKS